MTRYLPLLVAVALVASASLLWLSQRSAPSDPTLVISEPPANDEPATAALQTFEAAAELASAAGPTQANEPTAPAAPTTPTSTTSTSTTATPASAKRAARKALGEAELSALLQRRLTPAMRRDINQQLQPAGQAPQLRQGRYGSYLDLSDRASSVVIAVIDDDGGTVVTDITTPLPVADQ